MSELRGIGVSPGYAAGPAHNAQALHLIASGAVPVADLITHRLPLERTLDAFDIVGRGEGIKVTIEP